MAQRQEAGLEGVATVLSIALRREQIPFWDSIAGRLRLDRSAGFEFEYTYLVTKAEAEEIFIYKVLV